MNIDLLRILFGSLYLTVCEIVALDLAWHNASIHHSPSSDLASSNIFACLKVRESYTSLSMYCSFDVAKN